MNPPQAIAIAQDAPELHLSKDELRLIQILRERNPAEHIPSYSTKKLGEQLADRITQLVGSWRFIIVQSILLVLWIICNILGWLGHWDPYPFILLNLCLSFQAAYTAPVILMSQNREAQIDRQKLQYYYEVNLKEELEIEMLHEKLDRLIASLEETQERDLTAARD
jgi:uncharacterized membrane protein